MDALGKKLDFHALRKTFATRLAQRGVAQRLTQELVRHQDANLTALNYTDANLLPTFDAVASLTWEGKAPAYSRGATPSEYLDRLDLQNQIFNDDIRLERVVLRNGKPIIVTSQPFIKGVAPSQIALDELMTGKGYEKLADGAYYDEDVGLLIFDLFPRNAIQTANGVIFPIDPVIQRVTPEFGLFLREHPYTINLN